MSHSSSQRESAARARQTLADNAILTGRCSDDEIDIFGLSAQEDHSNSFEDDISDAYSDSSVASRSSVASTSSKKRSRAETRAPNKMKKRLTLDDSEKQLYCELQPLWARKGPFAERQAGIRTFVQRVNAGRKPEETKITVQQIIKQVEKRRRSSQAARL